MKITKIKEKLEKLENLIQKNYEEDEKEGKILFPPDQLQVMSVKEKISRGLMPDKEDLDKMNMIYKVNKKKAKNKELSEWIEVKELIERGQTIFAILSLMNDVETIDNQNKMTMEEAIRIIKEKRYIDIIKKLENEEK